MKLKFTYFAYCMFILMSLNAFSFEEVWKVGDKFLPMIKEENEHLLLSKNCEARNCQAFQSLKTVSLKKIDAKKFVGGRNPGAVICDNLPEARIIYLKDLSGNENTFCFFKDKSMISSSSLYYYAEKNDGARK